MTRALLVLVALLALGLAVAPPASATKVVNENTDRLPPGCSEIAGDEEITVRGGRAFAREFPGVVYTFDRHSWDFDPCTRVTITFVNEDSVRHQLMPHGVFPNGFFLLEVDGPGEVTGTFIVGSEPTTYMVHCGVAQHQQKGMKAQITVGGGIGDLPNIPGVSGVPDAGDEGEDGAATGSIVGNLTVPGSLDTSILSLALAALLLVRRR